MSDDSAAIRIDQNREQDDQKHKTISSEDVANYLLNNPEFFKSHEDVLMELELPHRSGTAVSLLERQVAVLRERNIEARHRLNSLLNNARDNDTLFRRTRELVLALLEAHSLTDLVKRTESNIRNEFGADYCRLILLEGNGRSWDGKLNRMQADTASERLSGIMRQTRPMVGSLRPEENAALFGESGPSVRSAAVVALRKQGVFALLALGSHKSDRFHPEMGTIFLEFIGETLERLLPQYASQA